MRNIIILCSGLLLVLDLILLLYFGKTYTKTLIIPPLLYAHDLLLGVVFVLSIGYFKKGKGIRSIHLLFLISLLYLLASIYLRGTEILPIILRQYMVFGYCFLIYVIVRNLFGSARFSANFTKYLLYYSFVALLYQIVFLFQKSLIHGINPLLKKYYASPIVMVSLILMGAYVLVKIENKALKYLAFAFVFLIILTTGHDSAYLGAATVFLAYLFIKFNRKQRITLTLLCFFVFIGVFVLIPSFSDHNMQWRILFWNDSLDKIMQNYIIFGEGFGIQYASDTAIAQMNELFSTLIKGPQIVGEDRYLVGPHNSFISMLLHLGIVAIILLVYPLKDLWLNRHLVLQQDILFLLLALVGFFVFASFNVVLELPHSSSLIWIVYFGLIFKLHENIRISENKA